MLRPIYDLNINFFPADTDIRLQSNPKILFEKFLNVLDLEQFKLTTIIFIVVACKKKKDVEDQNLCLAYERSSLMCFTFLSWYRVTLFYIDSVLHVFHSNDKHNKLKRYRRFVDFHMPMFESVQLSELWLIVRSIQFETSKCTPYGSWKYILKISESIKKRLY